MSDLTKQRGIIKLIVIIIAAVLLLSYFQIDLRGWFAAHPIKPLFNQIWAATKAIWQILVKLWQDLTPVK